MVRQKPCVSGVLLHFMEHQLHHMFWLLGPFFIMLFSFWGLLALASQQEFELIMCSENLLYESLSSGNTPLVKKVSCGFEFCRVWSPVVRAGAGLVKSLKGGKTQKAVFLQT